jgi:hydroxymethylpyrimidine/phosphomethylpyrimidine kinase
VTTLAFVRLRLLKKAESWKENADIKDIILLTSSLSGCWDVQADALLARDAPRVQFALPALAAGATAGTGAGTTSSVASQLHRDLAKEDDVDIGLVVLGMERDVEDNDDGDLRIGKMRMQGKPGINAEHTL